MIQSSKYPHPDDVENNIVARIQRLTAEVARRAPDEMDASREFARAHIDNLDAIEEALENLIAAMNDTDDLADEHRPETAAALSIERMALAAVYSTLEVTK